jgi:hypothetical protein
MPLWGSVDNAANSDIAALMQVSSHVDTANQALLYNNVTIGAFQSSNVIVGQFGVDTNEITALNATPGAAHPQHAGWVLRREGTGLRAGRVTYETLVAMGSMSGDGSDDTWVPEYYLSITTQPTSNTSNVKALLTFTVAATSTPSGAPLVYHWQVNTGSSWANVANVNGTYVNNTSPTFSANNLLANGNVFRCLVTSTGANAVTSTSATILYVV